MPLLAGRSQVSDLGYENTRGLWLTNTEWAGLQQETGSSGQKVPAVKSTMFPMVGAELVAEECERLPGCWWKAPMP